MQKLILIPRFTQGEDRPLRGRLVHRFDAGEQRAFCGAQQGLMTAHRDDATCVLCLRRTS